MAITTIDGIIGGFQPPQDIFKIGSATVAGRFFSLFYNTGRPGAATAPSPGISGAALTSYAGQIPFSNPDSGENTYLAKFHGISTVAGALYLCDRLWHNSGIGVTSTAVQTINSVQFPPRDATGGTSGNSILIGVEVTSVMGAGAPTWTMNYTASNGITATTITSNQPTALPASSFIPIQLAFGHTGVQKINWWQQSATMTSGAYSLVAYRILARIDLPTANVGNYLDCIQLGMPRLYDNTVPFLLWMPSTTTVPTINSQIIYTQG